MQAQVRGEEESHRVRVPAHPSPSPRWLLLQAQSSWEAQTRSRSCSKDGEWSPALESFPSSRPLRSCSGAGLDDTLCTLDRPQGLGQACFRQGHCGPPSPIFSRVWGTPKEDHTRPALLKCGEGLQADGSLQPCKEEVPAGLALGGRLPGLHRQSKTASSAGGACDLRGFGDLRSGGSASHAQKSFFLLSGTGACSTKGNLGRGGRPGPCPRAGSALCVTWPVTAASLCVT